MILPALYHWSPTSRRADILKFGLMPYSFNVVASGPLPHICLAPTPSTAWGLSGGTGWHEAEEWDLWQVRIGPNDEVHVRPEFGDVIKEITVRNVIPPDRIWLVGSRNK